jgi:hypothetical protein
MDPSLTGKWILQPEGSDHYHGLDMVQGMPMLAYVSGNEKQFMNITTSVPPTDTEEIIIACQSARGKNEDHFQLGKLNFFMCEKGPILSAVVYCNDFFREFSLLWLGPNPSQRCLAHFRLGRRGKELRVDFQILAPEMGFLKLVKYFSRCPNSVDTNIPPQSFQKILPLVCATRGWVTADTSASALEGIETSITASCKIHLQAQNGAMSGPHQLHTSTDTEGVSFSDPDLRPLKRFDSIFSDNEEATFFVVDVSSEGRKWQVLHRYREFHALFTFILSQLQDKSQTGAVSTIRSQFPGKSFQAVRGNSLLQRQTMLARWLKSTLSFACSTSSNNIADALHAFLETPEHSAPDGADASAPKPFENPGNPEIVSIIDNHRTIVPFNLTPWRKSLVETIGGEGIKIYKFSRSALTRKPQSRILKCNEDCTQITWSKGVDEKTSKLDFAQIVEVRAGAGDITPFEESESGTATLRRCAKPDDMMRCFSLITKSRTIDFMCLSATDFEVLFSRFKGACLEANGVRYR